MQCVAVLLLEMAYKARHTKNNHGEIEADIRKLMNWLRAMQSNDPVARRAYHVVRKILQHCAPVLQAKAAELLSEDSPSQPAGHDTFRSFDSTPSMQNPGLDWSQGQFYDESNSMFGHQYYQSGPASTSTYDAVYANLAEEQTYRPSTFGNPFVNYWDEGMPAFNMQDLWSNPSHLPNTDYLGDLGDMDRTGVHPS